ncbi:MAG: 16S rRNA (cytosine(1402)-N(4))-methyltransferase RsmH [Planctomycetales bacterium]|nr:16S rRNA (cytosine(1402)-N(4))-methyltransferase RsmH [Planctomycetales bacterium]
MAACDATVGEGGHAEAILEATGPDGPLVGCDRDPEILAVAGLRLSPFGGRVRLARADFGEPGSLRDACGDVEPRAVLLDLGISSWHLARAERGFSFDLDGPLDMRVDRESGDPTAAERLARLGYAELRRALRELADERGAGRIARAILGARDRGELRTTRDLARTVERAAGRHGRIHPATRTFQALRILVNDEHGRLARGLDEALGLLPPGGRLAVISFHSGEDRIVKGRFRERAREGRVKILTKKPIFPGEGEVAGNPRARSARVRAAEVTP